MMRQSVSLVLHLVLFVLDASLGLCWTGAAQREKALTQDMEALLEDSEAAEARYVSPS